MADPMTRLEHIVSRLINKEAVKTMGQLEFKHLLGESDGKVLDELGKKLLDTIYKSCNMDNHIKVSDLKDLLKHVDKKLFTQLIDN